ncbi:EamA family transporter [Psychromonas sp. KJ10-10]|uniref:EamA family transporter n=1 Tax=Psychromonas sp. KJ10-10 TaxID=3391823 RepID=UPI0039B394C6
MIALSCYALTNNIQEISISGSDTIVIILLGLGPMGLSFYSWDYAIRNGDPRLIGALAYLTPLLSVVFMALFIPAVTLKLVHIVTLVLVIGGASLGPYIEKRNRKIQVSSEALTSIQ